MAAYCGARFAVGVDSGTSALELSLAAPRCRARRRGRDRRQHVHRHGRWRSPTRGRGAGSSTSTLRPGTWTRRRWPAPSRARARACPSTCTAARPTWRRSRPSRRGRRLVVEDASQAHGAMTRRRRVRRAGTLGRPPRSASTRPRTWAGSVTLGRGHDLGRAGGRVDRLRDHGQACKNAHTEVGWADRLDELQAAVLPVKLRRSRPGTRPAAAAARYATPSPGSATWSHRPRRRPSPSTTCSWSWTPAPRPAARTSARTASRLASTTPSPYTCSRPTRRWT